MSPDKENDIRRFLSGCGFKLKDIVKVASKMRLEQQELLAASLVALDDEEQK